MQLKLPTKAMLLIVIPLALELGCMAWLGALLQQSEQEEARVDHARQVTTHINHMLLSMMFGVGGLQVWAMTRDRAYGTRADSLEASLHKELDETDALCQNNPTERDLLKTFRQTAEEGVASLARVRKLVGNGYVVEGMKALTEEKMILQRVTNQAETLLDFEQVIEESSPKVQSEQRAKIQWMLIVLSGMTVLVGISLTWGFNKGILERLNVVIENSIRLAAGKQLKERVSGDDEIGQLDRSFHSMARALAEAARKERAVTENARDVICSLDRQYKFIAVNPASLPLWGFAPDELPGKRAVDLICRQDREAFTATLEGFARNQAADAEIENRVVAKDGRLIDALWSMHWSQQEQSLFCVVHDISARKEAERLKQEFVAMISHDLRTPLTSVKGTLSMIAEGVYDTTTEVGKKRLNTAQESIDRLINLINDLLDIEKMEAGMLQMQIEDADLAEIIRRSIDAVSGFAEKRQIAIECEKIDVHVNADDERLVQVVVNLLSNAIKFSPDGSTINISAVPVDRLIEVRVQDQGRGVPEPFRDSIFERFKQVQESDGKLRSGTGLGLAICRAIVQAHDGTIGLQSEENKGSTFWFRIPFSTAVKSIAAKAAESTS
jgi:PAS domain S-box-containing protein